MFQSFANDPSTHGGTKRLSALRKAMRDGGLDGFIVPREDEFQGEYVPAANERLKWLSGFGGSAGLAVVMARKAALFVDGRYILQAPQQVDDTKFEIVLVSAQSPTAWLDRHLKKGQTLGLDPRLHSHQTVEGFRKLARRKGAKIKLVDTNPLDSIWLDRPPLPSSPVEPQPVKLTGKASMAKRQMLADTLAQNAVDAALISQPENIAWLLNIRATDVPHTPFALSFGLLHKSGKFDWYIEPARVSAKVRQHIGAGVKLVKPAAMMADLRKRKTARIGFDPASTPAVFTAALANGVAMDDPCALPKACKTKAEITGTVNAHIRDGAALSRFLCWLETAAASGKVSEIDAAMKAEALRAETGQLRDLSFDTISGTGPNGAIVHYRVTEATNRMLKPGDLYLIDSGGQYQDGTTDVTRTVLVGRKAAGKDQMAAFTRVLRGHIALAMVRFPEGTNGMQLDTLARAPLWAAGQDFDHGTGHGVGSYLSVHEGPQRISKGGLVPLQAGMIVSNEPGYYRAGKFGIRIENLQYVVAGSKPQGGDRPMLGFAPLTLAPIERRLIDKKQLSQAEGAWLDAYHKSVRQQLRPLVDPKTAKWLDKVCQPL